MTYSILPPLCRLLGLEFNGGYQLPIAGGGYIIYPVLGYLLATGKITTKWFVMICAGAVGALALRYGVTYFLTIHDGATNSVLFNYIYFTAVLPSVAVYMIAQRISWHNYIKGKAVAVLTTISSCSLGVYLIHMFVMDAELGLLNLDGTSRLWRVAMPVVTYLICLAIVWTIKSGVISRRLFP